MLVYPIYSAQALYVELIEELVNNYYANNGFLELSAKEITEEMANNAQKEIMDNLTPYLHALPEYGELGVKTVKKQGNYIPNLTRPWMI